MITAMALDSKMAAAVAAAPRWPVIAPPVAYERMPRHIAIITGWQRPLGDGARDDSRQWA